MPTREGIMLCWTGWALQAHQCCKRQRKHLGACSVVAIKYSDGKCLAQGSYVLGRGPEREE